MWFSDEARRNPFPLYEQMRARSRVAQIPSTDLWMLLDYDDVKRALSDPESFSSDVTPARGVRFEWLLFMDPPRHTKLRAIVTRAFTPRSIAALEPRVRAIARELLDRALARDVMDVAADLAVPLPVLVIAAMLGLPLGDWARAKRWSDAIVGLAATIFGPPEAAQAASDVFQAADAEMATYFAALVEDRRRSPRDDLLTRLAEAEVDGERLGDEDLLRFAQLLLAAGTETTTNLIDNAVLCFLEHPGELARVRRAPELLPSAIEEVLRFRSPAQAMLRRVVRPVAIGDDVIPEGAFVLAVIGAANRDPKRFPEPARFDVTRDPNPHIAFGHGLHFCLGAPLSRLEARVTLGELLDRVDSFELAGEGAWEPRGAFNVHGPTRLPVRVKRR